MKPGKDILVAPMVGSMDARSEDGTVAFGNFRLLMNVLGDKDKVLCRLPGWRRYGWDSDCQMNHDLHDQMVESGLYYVVNRATAPGYTTQTGYTTRVYTVTTEVEDIVYDTIQAGPYCGYAPFLDYLTEFWPNTWFTCNSFDTPGEVSTLVDPASEGVGFTKWIFQCRGMPTSGNLGIIGFTVRWTIYKDGSSTSGDINVSELIPVHGTVYPIEVCLPNDIVPNDPENGTGFFQILNLQGTILNFYKTNPEEPCGEPIYDSTQYGYPCVDGGYIGSHYYLCYTPVIEGYTTVEEFTEQIPVVITTPDYEYEQYRGMYKLGGQCREHITTLYQFKATSGNRRLIAGTKSRLYVNNDKSGNWRVLADNLGGSCSPGCDCSGVRFSIDQLGNTAVIANGFDPVMAWTYDDIPGGDYLWSVEYVSDLRALGVSTANIVVQYKGFMIVADVVESGSSRPGRFYWSDFEDPTSFLPFGESLAGYHDIGQGERIVNIVPLDGRLIIYSDRAIYEADVVDDESLVFRVEEIYRGPHVPRFRYAIASSGKEHVYLSEDSLYVLYGNSRIPDSPGWLRDLGGVIYGGVKQDWVDGVDGASEFGPVNFSACKVASAGYDPVARAFWFSWPSENSSCPDKSLVIWPRHQRGSLVDNGFTAFTAYQPDKSPTLRDFMEEFGVCDASSLLVPKEGEACELGIPETGYANLYNETEDATGEMDPSSALAAMCDTCLEDYCFDCDGRPMFLMADVVDKCVKVYEENFYARERLESATTAEFPETGEGTYGDHGYTTLIVADAYDYRDKSDKVVDRCRVEFTATLQPEPSLLQFDVATGEQPGCMKWIDGEPVEVACLDGGVADDDGRPTEGAVFNFWEAGRWVAWRTHVGGVGGQLCVSDVVLKVGKRTVCW